MKHRGLWVTICIVLILFGISGDSDVHTASKYQESDFVTAAIELKSNPETIQVQPGKILLDQAVQQPQDPIAIEEENIFDQVVENQLLEEDIGEEDLGMDELQTITLMTFNMRSANNADGLVQLEKIIEEIRESQADIIGLQEVERMMPRSGYQDQARIIAEELGYHYYYGENINILGVKYGNALISKYPILKATNHNLPKERLEPRGMIEADVDINGSLWHIYITHLGLNSVERNKQIHYIDNIISQREGNILLMGDFNNHPDSSEMNALDQRMVDSAAALDCSDYYTFAWQDDIPNVRIDRIYASDNITLFSHEVKPSAVSDHERVLTQILFNILQEAGI